MRDDKDRSLGRRIEEACSAALPDDRMARFQRRVLESPVDRACLALSRAGDELNDAIQLAGSQRELSQLRDVIMETIARLETSWRVNMVLDEHWNERKS
jgi:hypothetical protein